MYPIAKGKLTLDYIRDYLHLRPRTYTIEAVARVRSALAFATHKFFQERGFHYVHTPIVTASDTEGAGEMFQVGVVKSGDKVDKIHNGPPNRHRGYQGDSTTRHLGHTMYESTPRLSMRVYQIQFRAPMTLSSGTPASLLP